MRVLCLHIVIIIVQQNTLMLIVLCDRPYSTQIYLDCSIPTLVTQQYFMLI